MARRFLIAAGLVLALTGCTVNPMWYPHGHHDNRPPCVSNSIPPHYCPPPEPGR